MMDIEVTLKLPSDLVERAQAVGFTLNDQAAVIVQLVENEIKRREAGQRLLSLAKGLDALPTQDKPSTDEIIAAVRQARAERNNPDS